jgi:hypothetical protein
MSKKVKESDNGAPELSVDQVTVIYCLLSGKTQREAAQAAKVNESTVSRWMHQDAAFIAAYNAGLQSVYDASMAELLDLRRKATQTLGEMQEKGDWRKRLKAAELILKYAPARPEMPTNQDDIALELKEAQKARDSAERWDFGL